METQEQRRETEKGKRMITKLEAIFRREVGEDYFRILSDSVPTRKPSAQLRHHFRKSLSEGGDLPWCAISFPRPSRFSHWSMNATRLRPPVVVDRFGGGANRRRSSSALS